MRYLSSIQWLGRPRVSFGCILTLAGLLCSFRTAAVIFYATSDPTHNTSAPTESPDGKGWQYVGQWGGFVGTVISDNCFVTAVHIGGNIGDQFLYGGKSYTTVAVFRDPTSDLAIWRVCGTFPSFAPLYSGQSEAGQNFIVIGRGTQRGVEVAVQGALKGWQWGAGDGVQRWGENRVNTILVEGSLNYLSGPEVRGGDFLVATFDASGLADEASLSSGDSGGPVFLSDNGVWKLAGLCFAVQGPFNTSNSGPGFQAALFETGGMYEQNGDTWVYHPGGLFASPSSWYATRICTRMSWIQQTLQNAASPIPPTLESAAQPQGPYQEETTAVLDSGARQFSVNASGETRFYRLRTCDVLRITQIQMQSGRVIIRY